MPRPRFPKEQVAFACLRAGDLDGFHSAVRGQRAVDLSDADLRGVDLRKADLSNVVLRGAYLRDADLRGLDLRHLDLAGCSILHAKISGAFFPANLSAEEIRLSQEQGTRLRPTPARD
jgi:uncharacterized protein YjbI with pentapeptide repeats